MFENTFKLHAIRKFMDEYMEESEEIFVGGLTVNTGRWNTVANALFDSKSPLWGPGEPSGDGVCTDMLFKENWIPKWRINDEDCFKQIGFVCQKPMPAGKHLVCVVLYLVSPK